MRLNNCHFSSLFIGLIFSSFALVANAQSLDFFRIGTGGKSGTYYPIGKLVAQAINMPPKLIAVPQTSNGSVSNVKDVDAGLLEAGFAQSDVVYWAYTGSGTFKGSAPVTSLRVIANLYPESIHLVARLGAHIKSVHDLKGKRVSLDQSGSGTLEDARIILKAYGLSEQDLDVEYIKPDKAAQLMEAGELDAFFIVAGYPTTTVLGLTSHGVGQLVPIDGAEAKGLLRQYGFFAQHEIPANIYINNAPVQTLSVGAQWIVNAKLDEKIAYEITKKVWSSAARKLLDDGHPKGREIVLNRALDGIGIPLHPGAARYYKELGVIK